MGTSRLMRRNRNNFFPSLQDTKREKKARRKREWLKVDHETAVKRRRVSSLHRMLNILFFSISLSFFLDFLMTFFPPSSVASCVVFSKVMEEGTHRATPHAKKKMMMTKTESRLLVHRMSVVLVFRHAFPTEGLFHQLSYKKPMQPSVTL